MDHILSHKKIIRPLHPPYVLAERLRLLAFAQRARAAFVASSFLSSSVRAAMRAFTPLAFLSRCRPRTCQCLEQNSQLSETSRLNWNANSRRRKGVVPFGLQRMRAKWRPCTTQQNGSKHAWKPLTCSKGDSRTALWMIQKSDIQRSRMLVNFWPLANRREPMPLLVGKIPKRNRGQGRL